MKKVVLVPLTWGLDWWMFFNAEMRERRYAKRARSWRV